MKILKNRFLTIVLLVAMFFTLAPEQTKAAATVTYSLTYGEQTITYVDGQVSLKVESKDIILCNKDTVAREYLFCDKYGTIWAVSRGGKLLWANYKIMGTGRQCYFLEWKGIKDSEVIVAYALVCKGSTNNIATHYTNEKMQDIPLPTYDELYSCWHNGETVSTPKPTPVETKEPKEAKETQAPKAKVEETQSPKQTEQNAKTKDSTSSSNINNNNNNSNSNVNNNNNNITIKNNSSKANKTKKKTSFWYVKRSGNRVRLMRRKAGKSGQIFQVTFNKKSSVAKADGTVYRGIKYVGYTSISRQIVLLKKNGQCWIVARGKKKNRQVYTYRVIQGNWKLAIENTHGLVLRLSDKQGHVKSVTKVQPRKI